MKFVVVAERPVDFEKVPRVRVWPTTAEGPDAPPSPWSAKSVPVAASRNTMPLVVNPGRVSARSSRIAPPPPFQSRTRAEALLPRLAAEVTRTVPLSSLTCPLKEERLSPWSQSVVP